MNTLAVIPARFASTRFPGKPLVEIKGKSMIQRVYEQVEKTARVNEQIVATDDQRIFEHVKNFGGKVVMTQPDHTSGTDRCAEVARKHSEFDLVVNIQGDEPFIDPQQIDQVIELFEEGSNVMIGTLAKVIKDSKALFNPNVVKVVMNNQQEAMYFSRATLPYLRNEPQDNWLEAAKFYKHIGIYAFRANVLLELTSLPQGHYEKAESLEQLRWLENGFSIKIGITQKETLGIDTPEDLQQILAKL